MSKVTNYYNGLIDAKHVRKFFQSILQFSHLLIRWLIKELGVSEAICGCLLNVNGHYLCFMTTSNWNENIHIIILLCDQSWTISLRHQNKLVLKIGHHKFRSFWGDTQYIIVMCIVIWPLRHLYKKFSIKLQFSLYFSLIRKLSMRVSLSHISACYERYTLMCVMRGIPLCVRVIKGVHDPYQCML